MSGVSSTIVGGIQDISALLPLVGTEQCEEHVGSALDKGFLYVCISPISIFGSLGIVRAAFNIFLATLNIRSLNFIGAKKLYDGGFDLKGSVKEMIALDPAYPNRFLAESRLEAMLEDEYIENLENLTVTWNEENLWWNIKLVLFTVLSAPLGLTPYLYIILKLHNSSDDPLFLSGWGFPIMRLVGSSICAIVAQLLIQMRILVIIKMRLLFLSIDRLAQKSHVNLESEPYNLSWNSHSASETCLWELERYLKAHNDDDEKNLNLKQIRSHLHIERLRQFPPHFLLTRYSTNVLLHLLVAVGIVLSVLGYVGCFNLIQNATQNSAGPPIWLGLEIVLSVLRIVVWMFNPSWDDSEWGINFKLKPASHPPLVTCYKSQSDIEKNGVELTIRVDNYLEEILAYTGPLERFRWKDVTLQYILAPKDAPPGSLHAPNASLHGILYIIVFYKEQLCWTLFKGPNNSVELRSASRIDVPGRTTIRMHAVARPGAHNLTANTKFIEKLTKHYNHVIQQIRHTRGDDDEVDFHKTWSMQDTESENKLEAADNAGQGDSIKLTAVDLAYVRQEQLQRRWTNMLGDLEDWIKFYVALYREELIQDLSIHAKDVVVGVGLPPEYRSVDLVKKHEANEMEYLLIECQTQMELLLTSISTKWSLLVQRQHRQMLTDVLKTMFPEDFTAAQINAATFNEGAQQGEGDTKHQKLRNRLFDEWQRVLAETKAQRAENMRRRLDEQADSTTKRIEGRKYKDPAGDDIIAVWKARLGLLDEEALMASTQPTSRSYATENDQSGIGEITHTNEVNVAAHEFKRTIEIPFRAGLEERYHRGLEELGPTLRDDNITNDFTLMINRCRKRADQLFSRLEDQWNEFQELDNIDFLVADEHNGKRSYWSHDALRERRRLMNRAQKHLSISNASVDVFGGFQNMARALSRSQNFVVVDFTAVTSPELTIERIVQLLKDVRSITSVVLPKGYPDALLKAIGANVDLAIEKRQDICLYWGIRVVAGQSGTSKPYIVFQERGVSACQVAFFISHENKDHIITLEHLVSATGRVDIALNGHLLECASGTWGQSEILKNEDILLPSAYLNIEKPNHLEIVLTAMTDCEGVYWLSDVVLPVRVAHGTITASTLLSPSSF